MTPDRIIGFQHNIYQPTSEELQQLYSLALSSLNVMSRRRWYNNNKTGHLYLRIGEASMQLSDPVEITQNTPLIVYQAVSNDAFYARTVAEFEAKFTLHNTKEFK